MKKMGLVLLALTLCLALTAGAAASVTGGSGAGAVYIGADGAVYDQADAPIVGGNVRSIAYADDGALVFEETDDAGDTRLMKLERADDAEPSALAQIVPGAVLIEEDRAVYCLDAEDAAKLLAYRVEEGEIETALTADSAIEGIRASVDGLLVTVDGAEKRLDGENAELVDPFADASGLTLAVSGHYETALDGAGALSLRAGSADAYTPIATNVMAGAIAGGRVYYLQKIGSGARVMEYSIEGGASERVEYFSEAMMAALAVEGKAYVVDQAGNVYALDLEGTEGAEKIGALDREGVTDCRLFVQNGTLLVYGAGEEGALEFITAYAVGDREEPEPEEPAYETLKRGSRGDDVKALQQALRDLGYPAGTADGVYGGGTERAVTYLQFDMGLEQTGEADPALQQAVFNGEAPEYEIYVALSRGDSGIRVSDVQTLLYDLYYTKEAPDGSYGGSTAEAVKRFQSEIGNKENGNTITAKQVTALNKKNAPECTTYYELRKDDEAPVVARLNKRLKKLGYLYAAAGELYTKHTVQAIRDFQYQAGLKETGVADAKTQLELFAKYPPTPEPTPEPTPPPADVQVVGDSAIKTLRTWMKNNLDLDYKKKEAVAFMQTRLSELGYLNIYPGFPSVYNTATKEAVAAFQSDNGIKADGIVNKKTLSALLGKYA